MNKQEILQQIKNKRSYLCVGLDTDIEKIPTHLNHYNDPIFEFNKQIIDATRDLCIAYKPNTIQRSRVASIICLLNSNIGSL